MYPLGYYLSDRHVGRVMLDLEDTLYNTASRRSLPVPDSDKALVPYSEKVFDLEDRYSTARLWRLLNIYKPYYVHKNYTSESLEKLRDTSKGSLLSEHIYGSPIEGMPQTISDHILSQRLQSLVHGELLPSTIRAERYPWSLAYEREVEARLAEMGRYRSLDYTYPYLLNGYSYPYTKWLALQREIARVERQRSLNGYLSKEPSSSKGSMKAIESSESVYSRYRPHSVPLKEDMAAYSYRERPWDYMGMMRRKELQRSMDSLK